MAISGLEIGIASLLGLLIGSFLNVLVHRLPKMMERQWAADCAELSGTPAPTNTPFNLMTPRSSCPHCQHPIGWHENIPVISYLLLRGQCSACGKPISLRYPIVELCTAALFAYCAWRWGISPTAAAWCLFGCTLLSLALIDWDTTLLPDDLTMPLLWSGLISAALGWSSTPLPSAFWGAVAGYLSLWLIYWAFKMLTGKEGMGYGDFKLFAALGAWFGWPALIPIILLASVLGSVVGIAMKFRQNLREGGYVPFGPFLAVAGLGAMVVGSERLLAGIGL